MTEYTGSNLPLVTFALFAYNQEDYIREAVEGAFSQTYETLEIILSDDYSSDQTFEIMQEMAEEYEGPHTIRVRRNSRNLGLADHFNELVALAKGEILVVGAGDDISHSARTGDAVNSFQGDPQITFTECSLEEFDENGPRRIYQAFVEETRVTLDDLLRKRNLGLVGAGRSYRRSILTSFPDLNSDCPTEDTTNVLRCLMSGTGLYVPIARVRRRIHDNNLSSPNGMHSEKLQAISRQYNSDILAAYRDEKIDSATMMALQRKVRTAITERVLRQLHFEGFSLFEIVKKGFILGGPYPSTLKTIAKMMLR